jgi:hypothetical protein
MINNCDQNRDGKRKQLQWFSACVKLFFAAKNGLTSKG